MTLSLFEHPDYEDRIGITETGAVVEGGAFFLDFSRPLELQRRFGLVVGALVPVVHQGERKGAFVAAVDRSDPLFDRLRLLWKTNYPSNDLEPRLLAEGLAVARDFAIQFPSSVD